MICKVCSNEIGDAVVCPICGAENASGRSRFFAGVLQLLCGCLGLGRFYLGYRSIGALQVLVSFLTCGIGGVIWGIADSLMIFSWKVIYDGEGKELL